MFMGCALKQEQVDEVIAEVYKFSKTKDFTQKLISECVSYDIEKLYEKGSWEESFTDILNQVKNSNMIFEIERECAKKKGIDYKKYSEKLKELASKDDYDTYDKNRYWTLIYDALGSVVSTQKDYIRSISLDNPANCIVKSKYLVNTKDYLGAIPVLKKGIALVKELQKLDNSYGSTQAMLDIEDIKNSKQKELARKICYLLGYSCLMEQKSDLAVKYSSIAWQLDESDSQTLFIAGWALSSNGHQYEGKSAMIKAAQMGNTMAKIMCKNCGWY